jgi:ATP-dependent Clp protease ATP-binding subunit ClpA
VKKNPKKMPDTKSQSVARIETLVKTAAEVARSHKCDLVGAEHLLFVIAGTEDGRRAIEGQGGDPKKIRSFLEAVFDHNARDAKSDTVTQISATLQHVIQRPVHSAQINQRLIRMRDIITEMKSLGKACMNTREALRAGGLLEKARPEKEDYRLEEEVSDQTQGQDGHGSAENRQDEASEHSDDQHDTHPSDNELNDMRAEARPGPSQGAQAEEADEHLVAVRRAMRNLTELAAAGRLDDVIGRELEIERALETMQRRRKPNVILAGEPGVGKTAIAEGLALRLARQNVPEQLRGRPLYEVAISDLVAGARFRGDFEARMARLMTLAREERAILFMDEFHLISGAGSGAGRGGMDASNILKPALARGEMIVFGATTPGEMRQLRKDGALMRRFDVQFVDEPSPVLTRKIIDEAVGSYVLHHEIGFGDDMLDEVVALADRYLPARRFPDKAFDLIDTSLIIAKSRSASAVAIEDVRAAVTRLGGLRLAAPSEEERASLETLHERLSHRVFGQEKAVTALSRAVRATAFGLQPGGTAGAYLFNGPTGVGKTELARAFAQEMNLPLVRIDMSEFMEKHSVSGLVGAPPGYVGFEEDGRLIAAAESYPQMVLLLDEAEKAHPDVFNILLQMLDGGHLRSGDGRLVSFAGAHVILTANLGAADGEKASIGFGRQTDPEEAAQSAIKGAFRRELLARIRNQIQFSPIEGEVVTQIAQQELRKMALRLADNGVSVKYSDDLAEWLSAGEGPGGSASRGLQDKILSKVSDPLTDWMISNPGERAVKLSMADDEICIEAC